VSECVVLSENVHVCVSECVLFSVCVCVSFNKAVCVFLDAQWNNLRVDDVGQNTPLTLMEHLEKLWNK